jgi:Domain of unknown function (DUF4375)
MAEAVHNTRSACYSAPRNVDEIWGQGMLVDGRMTTVVVRREDRDAANQPGNGQLLVSAIVGYVNDIQRSGVYGRHELLPALMQAYHADYYLAQVDNGGHSQFIGNTGAIQLPITGADALAGLEAMGAHAQHQILAEMMAWVKANPQEAAAQNGFSVRAPSLDQLDNRFCEAEGQTPISELSAKWISSWPQLRVVTADQYAGEIERLAQLNPYLEARRIWYSVQQLRFQMTDPLKITIAAACGAVKPHPELKLAVHAGSNMEIEGQMCKAFGLHTDRGLRLCVFEDAGGRLYEYIESTPFPESPTPENLKNYRPPVVGRRLSTVGADRIRQFVDIAENLFCAEAIDLLLRKGGFDSNAVVTAWELVDSSASWILATGKDRFAAVVFAQGAVLTKPDTTPLLRVSRAEIDHHASQVTIAQDTMRPPN